MTTNSVPRALFLDDQTAVFYLTLQSSQIVIFQALIESYEGMGTVRTVDVQRSLIALITPCSQVADCQRLLAGLKKEVRWECAADIVGEVTPERILTEK